MDDYRIALIPDENGEAVHIKNEGERNMIEGKDDRDRIPYEVYLTLDKKPIKNEKRKDMGKYLLDPNVSVGEYILIEGKSYRIKRVTFVYEFRNKKHVVTAKKLDVYLSTFVYSDIGEEMLQ